MRLFLLPGYICCTIAKFLNNSFWIWTFLKFVESDLLFSENTQQSISVDTRNGYSECV